jgi:hypothetical protein
MQHIGQARESIYSVARQQLFKDEVKLTPEFKKGSQTLANAPELVAE